MRLSAEIISQSEQRINPLGEREIILRGLSIPLIEHLAVTQNQFDAIDLTDNLITKLTNFPKLARLSSLSLAGNAVESVDERNLKKNLSGLRHLNLAGNKVKGLHVLGCIGDGCPHLESLVLVGNPVVSEYWYLVPVKFKCRDIGCMHVHTYKIYSIISPPFSSFSIS